MRTVKRFGPDVGNSAMTLKIGKNAAEEEIVLNNDTRYLLQQREHMCMELRIPHVIKNSVELGGDAYEVVHRPELDESADLIADFLAYPSVIRHNAFDVVVTAQFG